MSDYICDVCKTIEKPLVKIVKEEDEEVWLCMKHLFMQILDAGMKEMHTNMADYSGVLFNYKDEYQK